MNSKDSRIIIENQQNIIHIEGLIKESFTFNDLIRERTFYKK